MPIHALAAHIEEAVRLAREGLESATRDDDLGSARRYLRIWELLVTAAEGTAATDSLDAETVAQDPGPIEPTGTVAEPSTVDPVPAAGERLLVSDFVAYVAGESEAPGDESVEKTVGDDLAQADAEDANRPASLPETVVEARPTTEESVRVLCAKVREFESDSSDEPTARCAEAKALLCDIFGLWDDAKAAGLDPILQGEWDALRRQLNRFNAGEFFDAMSPYQQPSWGWRELAEGYRYVAGSERLTTLLTTGDATEEQVRFGVLHAAAGQAMAARWYLRQNLTMDPALVRLRNELLELAGERFFIPWWKVEGPNAADPAKIRDSARGIEAARSKLAPSITARTKRLDSAKRTGEALRRLNERLDAPGEGDTFEDTLLEAIEAALAAGVPPSNKELRRLLGGYHHVAERVTHGQGKKLAEYLRQDQTNAVARKEIPTEPAESPEVTGWIEELRPLLKGKTLLLIGGNKGQSHRKSDYKERLGLAEVLWPDLEETDKPAIARPQLDKADIVAYIVRFSRHSYKSLLDEAKAMGKTTVTVPRGYGLNTVIKDMHEQLLRPALNGKSPANGTR